MEQYIKDILGEFLKTLKKLWILGVVVVFAAVLFVVVTTMGKANGGSHQSILWNGLLGVESFHKLSWEFEDEALSEEYGVVIEDAKERIEAVNAIVQSSGFKKKLNDQLAQLGLEALSADDRYKVKVETYDVMAIRVIGTDAEKAVAIEKFLISYVVDFMTNTYDVSKVECIVESCLAEVSLEGGEYVFGTAIVEQENEIIVDEITPDFITLSNLVIVLSAVALYAVVVFLIAITNYNEKKSDL